MKRIWIAAVLVMLVGLSGCQGQEEKVPAGLIFDRGSGSAWGNQLYMEVRGTQIVVLRRVAADTGQLETLEHIPIEPEQWETLLGKVSELEQPRDTLSWLRRLLGHSKLDGGVYRNLWLIYPDGEEEITTRYQWPEGTRAQELEAMLEQLARSVPQTPADCLETGAGS